MDFGLFITTSQEEFLLFYNIDRELYKILVINFSWESMKSMQILALWLWLEHVGFCIMVKKILSLPNILINELADEVVTCLNCINTSQAYNVFLLQKQWYTPST